mmetsp:Transcript_14792/g.32375  ORF Transcript_14792/g.32375 Transcript_14792/m.32375 type:complete len:214 (+) Transcript_14792:2139-2780(+)
MARLLPHAGHHAHAHNAAERRHTDRYRVRQRGAARHTGRLEHSRAVPRRHRASRRRLRLLPAAAVLLPQQLAGRQLLWAHRPGRRLLRADHHLSLPQGGRIGLSHPLLRPRRRKLVLEQPPCAHIAGRRRGGTQSVYICGLRVAHESARRYSHLGAGAQRAFDAARVYLGVLHRVVVYTGRGQGVHVQVPEGLQRVLLQRHRHGAQPPQPLHL